jgi:hypothetical protein
MSRFGRNVECEHARIWAALAPDGELSELERRSLRSHLRVCASCTSFAQEVEGTTSLLRSEALVRPSSIAAVTRLAPRRHARLARVRPVAAAAAVALMALGVASRAPLPVDERDSGLRTTTTAVAPEQLEMRSLRILRQGALAVAERAKLDPMPSVMENEPT